MYSVIKKIRSKLLVYLTHQMALPFLRLVRRPEVFPYTLDLLQQFPAGTLGHELFDFLDKRKLPLLPYYARHDIKHILLGYDTTDDGEVCLQCFMLGNGNISFPVAATVVYGCVTMPEHWAKFREAYKRGRKAVSISNWEWFNIIPESTVLLRKKINHSL